MPSLSPQQYDEIILHMVDILTLPEESKHVISEGRKKLPESYSVTDTTALLGLCAMYCDIYNKEAFRGFLQGLYGSHGRDGAFRRYERRTSLPEDVLEIMDLGKNFLYRFVDLNINIDPSRAMEFLTVATLFSSIAQVHTAARYAATAGTSSKQLDTYAKAVDKLSKQHTKLIETATHGTAESRQNLHAALLILRQRIVLEAHKTPILEIIKRWEEMPALSMPGVKEGITNAALIRETLTREYIDDIIAVALALQAVENQERLIRSGPTLRYLELHHRLDEMLNYGLDLLSNGHREGAVAVRLALDLKQQLMLFSRQPSPTEREKKSFTETFIQSLHSKDEEMSKHRKPWKAIIGHIALALTGVGLIIIGVHALVTHRFFLNKTTRENMVDTIDSAVKCLIK